MTVYDNKEVDNDKVEGEVQLLTADLISEDLKFLTLYCSASVTNLQKLEKFQLSAARIITGLRNTCPRDIVLFEEDLQPISLRRLSCLTKYYNKLRSLDPGNRTSAYFKDWCNNQRLRRNSPFSQMASFNLTTDAVEPHHLSQCFDPADDLDGIFFHPKLPRRNPDGCSIFRNALIAIDEAFGSLASLPNGKEIWILSGSRSAIQHLSNWQSVRDNVGVSVLTKLKRLSTSHQIHVQWIPSHIDLEGNEIADTLAKAGACEHHWYQCSRPGGSLAHGFKRQDQTVLARFRSVHLKTMKFSEGCKSFEMCTNCSSEPTSPPHILKCLGLTKQGLADDPLLVLDFLKVYDVMDLV
ncbi:RNase H domain-containing protein [Trichonephila clavipes]|nr:RNase H domain-containing protein [Trichonephila clavipes]